jgi:hypothetical protein
MVNLSAGDLRLEIDCGSRPRPGDVLQRWEYENDWQDVYRDRKLVIFPFDYKTLGTGRYRMRQS